MKIVQNTLKETKNSQMSQKEFRIGPKKVELVGFPKTRHFFFFCLDRIRTKHFLIENVQATPAMSTSRISILPLMSKWFFIPNIFSLYFSAFQLRLCWKRLTWSNGYLEVIFHALDVFSIIYATVYVVVKIGAHMGAILSASAMYI